MARKQSLAIYREPTPQQQLDYALDHAVEKAVLNHPQTRALRKALEAELKKAAKAPGAAASKRKKG